MAEPTPSPDARAVRRRRLRRAAAVLVGLAGAGLAAEVGARVMWRRLVREGETALQDGLPLGEALVAETVGNHVTAVERGDLRDPATYALDPARGFRLLPNLTTRRLHGGPDASIALRTDRLGLRGPERQPAPGGVLALGDSMTFGEGVQDEAAWPAVLEARLGRPVHNAGVVSYGPHEELAALRELAPRLRPSLVVWQLTVANDPTDALRWRLDGPPDRLVPDLEAPRRLAGGLTLSNPLAWWSRAYRLVAWRWARHAVRYAVSAEPDVLGRVVELVARGRAVLDATPATKGVPLVVLLAPSMPQVAGGPLARWAATTAVNEGLAAGLAARGLPVVDPLAGLRARAERSETLYIPGDWHWTPAGHAAVVEELLPVVQPLLQGKVSPQ